MTSCPASGGARQYYLCKTLIDTPEEKISFRKILDQKIAPAGNCSLVLVMIGWICSGRLASFASE